jgi:hypothetical protein
VDTRFVRTVSGFARAATWICSPIGIDAPTSRVRLTFPGAVDAVISALERRDYSVRVLTRGETFAAALHPMA